jgi:hypothetical protein
MVSPCTSFLEGYISVWYGLLNEVFAEAFNDNKKAGMVNWKKYFIQLTFFLGSINISLCSWSPAKPATGVSFLLGKEADQFCICHIGKVHHRFLATLAMPALAIWQHLVPTFMAAFGNVYLQVLGHDGSFG